jgi:hypothetical protein
MVCASRNLQRLRALLEASGGGEVLYERDARDSVCVALLPHLSLRRHL